jgi:hypothetical protein
MIDGDQGGGYWVGPSGDWRRDMGDGFGLETRGEWQAQADLAAAQRGDHDAAVRLVATTAVNLAEAIEADRLAKRAAAQAKAALEAAHADFTEALAVYHGKGSGR